MSKTRTIARALAPAIAIAAALTCGGPAIAASLPTEGFDANTLPAGWTRINNSDGNLSANKSWFKVVNLADDPLPFDAHGYVEGDPSTGSNNSFFQASVDSTTSTTGGTISNWLIGPTLTFNNGDKIDFFTRTVEGSNYPDRLELRFGKGIAPSPGVRTSSGSVTAEDVGDFTAVLVEINKDLVLGGYPEGWTPYSANITGLSGPTKGAFAFRYYVTNAGQFGDNSNYVGVDSVTVTAVPEPAAYLMMALGLGVIGLRRMRATQG